ncbi:glutamate-rich protein 6-like isoform X2 [Stegostoma tigrinum]|uniref:glutamate-rich protein 6-like isoform X2 n=1 Tax=Stegostoma tigrinum TaxID=3053191 RepID=UPI00287001CE|nr:glutamate-rich protein 6-like isoform X2 [Stegostoma tigrinum]
MSEFSKSKTDDSDSQELENFAQDADKSVPSSPSSIAESLTQTELRTDTTFYDGSSEIISDIVDSPVAILDPDKFPVTSVLTQTDSSWLLSHSHRQFDKDYESVVEDDVSDATSKGSLDDIIVHSEFIDDRISGRLFESAIYSLPSVGLPTILAHKHESKEQVIDYNAIRPKIRSTWLKDVKEISEIKEYWQWSQKKLMQEEHAFNEEQFKRSNRLMVEDSHLSKSPRHLGWNQFRKSVVSVGFDLCQFCGKNLKPIPTLKQLGAEPIETLFCCKQYRDLFEFFMKEEDLMRLKVGLQMIDISPHLPFGSVLERAQAKDKAALRLRDREMEKYLKKAKEGQSKMSAGPKKLSTITFQLSTSLDFVTLKEVKGESENWENVFTETRDDLFSWHKDLQLSFMVKYYRNGNKFLTAFPDGMAQVFYPSGNLAVQIFTDKQKKINCIVQEDKANDPAIRAVFSSYGRCTCYHPNGVVWININVLGGHCLDNQGSRVRRWYWRDRLSLAFIPFKPIFISLNENIGVRIIEQERIFINFLAMGKQAKFKVGTKLKFRRTSKLTLTNSLITEDELLLQASQLKVRTAINKMYIALNFPSNDPEKIPLPTFLTSQQQRLSQLRETIRMEESIKM